MTNKQIKDLVISAKTTEDLQPLHDYHVEVKKKADTIGKVIRALEMKVNSLAEIENIKNLTV